MYKLFVSIIGLIIFMISCSTDFGQPTPKALGAANTVTVVCDNALWNGPLGDTIRSYYESAYPMMPSAEPYFKLRHFTAEEILNNNLRRELRTYLIVANLADNESPTSKFIAADLGPEKMRKSKEIDTFNTSVGKNKWAEPQLLIYVFGQNTDDLSSAIRTSFPSAAKRIHDHDKSIIRPTVYLSDLNKSINDTLRAQFGIDIKIPGDYKMALKTDDAVWLRKTYKNSILYNIIISKRPYSSQDDLQEPSLIKWRNQLGKKLITGNREGSYMTTNDTDLPIYVTQEDLQGQYATHLRGIWELEGDFMGGPFFSYGILSPDQKEVLYIDGFVYGPGEPKQKHMQYIDFIIRSAKFL